MSQPTDQRKQFRVNFSLDEAIALEEEAKKQGVTPAALIRDAYRNSNFSSSSFVAQILESIQSHLSACICPELQDSLQAIEHRLTQIEQSLQKPLDQEQSRKGDLTLSEWANPTPANLSPESLESISRLIEHHLTTPINVIRLIHKHCDCEFLRWYVMKAEAETLYTVMMEIGFMLVTTQEQYEALHHLNVLCEMRRNNLDTAIPPIPDHLLRLTVQDSSV